MSSASYLSSEEFGLAALYGQGLLGDLGLDMPVTGAADHPALAWRRAGLMAVTGFADGDGLVCPAPLASVADGALLALKALATDADALPANGALLLGERARLMGLGRAGAISANGSCHLIAGLGGRLALSLARPDDWDLLPAWLEADVEPGDIAAVRAQVAQRAVPPLVERGVVLGLAIALDDLAETAGKPCFFPGEDRGPVGKQKEMGDSRNRESPPTGPRPSPGKRKNTEDTGTESAGWCAITHFGGHDRARADAPLVVDLSSLWAGPLAGSLLTMLGARVIKVESTTRPDGARGGHAGFYDLLNAGKASVALDFASPEGRAALARLVAAADIVIEGSRPRALRQLGIVAEDVARGGATWVSITGHGRDGDDGDRIGFGDDAAVAAGLATVMQRGWGTAMFAGDAIADPLTGLHAALAAWAGWRQGGGRLIALSLRGTVAHALGAGMADAATLREWQALACADTVPLYPFRSSGVAAALGADTERVFASC